MGSGDTQAHNDDERRVRELVERALADHDSDSETELLRALFRAGLAWVHFPSGAGGLGLPPKLNEVVDHALAAAGRRSSWLRNPIGLGMVAPVLAEWGDEEQRSHLEAIFTGEEIWCQMFSEPGAGSDVATLATRAVRDGDEWVLDGQKVWTSVAHLSAFGLVLARTDPDVPKHEGLTAFMLDMSAPGVEVRPLRQMTGDSHFNEIWMTGARVPDAHRIGPVGKGWAVAISTLMNERVSIGDAEELGGGAIELALAAWRDGGHDHPARRDELMRLWTEAEIHRLLVRRAQQLREAGTPGPEGSIAKLAGALLSQRILSFTTDLLGPAGMLVGGYGADIDFRTDPVLAMLGAQSNTIAGGTTEIMKNILGERVLGLPGDIRPDRGVPWRDIPRGA